jgi:predicted transposase YdaD
MKHKPSTTASSIAQPRTASDNLCKRLAEQFPVEFARWAFGVTGSIKVDKTELSREPIRADAVILSREGIEILHAEFQTTLKSDVPVPLRLLDYHVGFKRQNPQRRVRQVLIVLKATGEEIPDRYVDETTTHTYSVIKLWEVDPRELLKYDGLLPLATLCRAESGERLLSAVAARANRIKSREQRREMLNASRVFAGLRYDKTLVNRILKESDMLEESVIYQDILQKGELRGLQRGKLEGLQHEQNLVLRQLAHILGKVSSKTRKQIERLDFEQLGALGEALLDFSSENDLTAWLKQHATAR